jgi:hypothetical protein
MSDWCMSTSPVNSSVAAVVAPPSVGSGVAESVTAGADGSEAVGAGVLASALLDDGSGLDVDGAGELDEAAGEEAPGFEAPLSERPQAASTEVAARAAASARRRGAVRLTAAR